LGTVRTGISPVFSARRHRRGGVDAGVAGLWLGLGIGYYGPVGWHAHEMLFGYAAAVIAGFLLTAVRNWTGIGKPSGRPLALPVQHFLGRTLFSRTIWIVGFVFFVAVYAPTPCPCIEGQPGRGCVIPV
jgi:uncharacterized protein involved in response to NO